MTARDVIDRIITILRQERARQSAGVYHCHHCGEASIGLKHARQEAIDHAIEAVEMETGLMVERMKAASNAHRREKTKLADSVCANRKSILPLVPETTRKGSSLSRRDSAGVPGAGLNPASASIAVKERMS